MNRGRLLVDAVITTHHRGLSGIDPMQAFPLIFEPCRILCLIDIIVESEIERGFGRVYMPFAHIPRTIPLIVQPFGPRIRIEQSDSSGHCPDNKHCLAGQLVGIGV